MTPESLALDARRQDLAASPPDGPLHDTLIRIMNAEENLITCLMESGRISRPDAELVAALYRKIRAVKLHAGIGRYTVTHGAFWDRPVIRRALAIAKKQH